MPPLSISSLRFQFYPRLSPPLKDSSPHCTQIFKAHVTRACVQKSLLAERLISRQLPQHLIEIPAVCLRTTISKTAMHSQFQTCQFKRDLLFLVQYFFSLGNILFYSITTLLPYQLDNFTTAIFLFYIRSY